MKAKIISTLAISLLLMAMAAGTAVATAEEKEMDIKPGSFPNSINVKANGMIPVAILGNETSLDVRAVMLDTVVFAAYTGFDGFTPVEYKNGPNAGDVMAAYEDVNGDGIEDLVLHFKIDKDDRADYLPNAAAADPAGYLTLTAETENIGVPPYGAPIICHDSVRLLHT